ncbi:MAG: LamG domain-containing protein [Planctomycetaceae bacterium]
MLRTSALLVAYLWMASAASISRSAPPDAPLVGHWKLTGDARDSSGQENHGRNHGVTFDETAAAFNGVDGYIEVPHAKSLGLGTGDFTLAVWVHTDEKLKDVLGDILSKFDAETNTGLNFGIMNAVGATSAQSNYRHLYFGIDRDSKPELVDCGRPGNNKMIWALTTFDGHLYAGTWEPGDGEAGHVYRYEGTDVWTDLGSPDLCNTVSALGEHGGELYAGTSFYSGQGSAQPTSPNKNPGGKVFRYEGEDGWVDCGKIGEVYTVTGLVTFNGELYATTCDSYGCPSPKEACYRYDGDQKWTFVGSAGGRLGAFAVHNGDLYATVFSNDHGFARYDGRDGWLSLGVPPETGQTYSAVIYRGDVCLGTWPTGMVYRYADPKQFISMGRLGEEKEVMAMAVHNGKLYGGTLPLGEVYRYDGGEKWTNLGQIDTTPDVMYRRVWSMAVYDGKLYAGTLPSGHVFSIEAGKCVTNDRALAPGWRHIAAVKSDGLLTLYVDGKKVAQSTPFDASDFNLTNDKPLRIGFGEHAHFNGKMRDLRIYSAALDELQLNEAISAGR